MTKKDRLRRRNARRRMLGPQIRVEDEDGIYDEVDRFHMDYDDKLLKLVAKPTKPIAKEVLRIISDDEDDFYENLTTRHVSKASTNKWGKSRENYYGTSYTEKNTKDGINDSEEEEIFGLEEEDALIRQRRIESANSRVDLKRSFDSDTICQQELADILQIHHKKIFDKTNETLPNKGNSNPDNYKDHFEDKYDEDKDLDVASMSGVEEKNDSNRERRGITYEIRKNKGIRKDKGRRKGKQHSRVMKRIQYKKALIKKRSQVPDVQREFKKYDGEKRGIRISTIRSIKL